MPEVDVMNLNMRLTIGDRSVEWTVPLDVRTHDKDRSQVSVTAASDYIGEAARRALVEYANKYHLVEGLPADLISGDKVMVVQAVISSEGIHMTVTPAQRTPESKEG